MGATESRPRETRDGDGEEEIAVAVVGLGVAVAAGAAVVRLGVAAWNAMRSRVRRRNAEGAVALGNLMQSLSTTESSSSAALQRPQKRTFRFNVDGSEDRHATNKAGIGGVLKNENGEILYTFSESVQLTDITVEELTAIKRALEVFSKNRLFKWFGQYDELIVANDNEAAVNYAQGEQFLKPTTKNKDQISRLVGEIKKLVSAIGKVNIIKVDRDDIPDAHALAVQGRNIVEESANRDIFQALAAGAAVVGLGVAAWNAVRSPTS